MRGERENGEAHELVHLPARGGRGGGGSARGYKPGGVYLRPGSRAYEALHTLRLETERVGYARTATEWRLAHELRTETAAEGFDTTVFSLRKRGLAVVVGGRTRSMQYAVAAAPVPPTPTTDPYDVLTDVVAAACTAMGHAVDLERIASDIDARGFAFSSDQLSCMLEALVTTSEARAVPNQVAAQLELVHAKGAHWGRARRFWRPVGTDYTAPDSQPISRAAAIIGVAHEVARALGRPVSPVEMRAWALAHPDHPAATLVIRAGAARTRFAAALRAILRADGRRHDARLRDYSSALASDGGVPLRVGPPTLADAAVVTARFTDLCYAFRPSTEVDACARLVELADEDNVPVLAALANARLRSLTAALLDRFGGDACTADSAQIPWAEVEACAARAASTVRSWWEQSRPNQYARTPRWVTDAEEAARSVLVVRDLLATPEECAASVVAGRAGLRPMSDAISWLREMLVPQGRDVGTPQSFLHGVRRFDNPRWERDRLYAGEREAFSLLDVGDLMQVAADLTLCGNLAVLLRSASAMLGSVVRDVSLIRDVLQCLPRHATMYRHGTIVALGALGEVVTAADAIEHEGDGGGLEAFGLALALAPITPAERVERLTESRQMISAGLNDRLATMIERAEGGYSVSIVM